MAGNNRDNFAASFPEVTTRVRTPEEKMLIEEANTAPLDVDEHNPADPIRNNAAHLTGKLMVGKISTWRDQARCRGIDPDIFHPPEEEDGAIAEAKAICALCPAREPCLEYAIAARENEGVWGGMSARERRRLTRQRRRTA